MLHSIRVAGTHFTTSVASTRLRHVDLMSCWCGRCEAARRRNSDTFDPLLLALSQCTFLETLRLTKCLPRVYHIEDEVDKRCSPRLYVNLPHLRQLSIYDHPGTVSTLLSHVIVPSSASLDINIPGTFILPRPADLRTYPAITEAEHIFLDLTSYRSGYIMQVYARGDLTLRVTSAAHWRHAEYTSGSPALLYIRDAVEIFASAAKVTSLAVNENSPRGQWTTLLSVFPCLERLAIGPYSRDSTTSILEVLSRPRADGGCFCPCLRELLSFWHTRAAWPWMPKDTLLAMATSAEKDILTYYGLDQHCATMRSIRARLVSHVETGILYTWLPYGPTETELFTSTLVPLLRCRADLGALPMRKLTIGIGLYSEPDDADDDYLRWHMPAEPLERRLSTLLAGWVEEVAVTRCLGREQANTWFLSQVWVLICPSVWKKNGN